MDQIFRKTRVLCTVWFSHMSAYRAEIIIWILSNTTPLIMLAIWIAQAQENGGQIQGFTPPAFAAYFLAAWLTQQFTVAWVSWELSFQIQQGQLSPKLLRPLNPYWEHAAAHLTERVVRLPVILLILIVGVLLVPGTRLTPDVWHVAVYLVSSSLAWLIRFEIAYIIGIIAFWWENSVALDELYGSIAAFLTGSFAPLTFYPIWAQALLAWTPFPYIIYYPVQILTGAVNGAEMGRIMAIQLAWFLVLMVARQLLWQQGIRRYGAVGA